ncbi:hypothetical protein MKY41_02200 [Sporosarcina sp. FSL W7-1349]|uniref:hypothetical protein n=1 Tax=Sporosarcina sp. FSL W7-1349 TaxID=2921561 RepID=UPI0030FB5423
MEIYIANKPLLSVSNFVCDVSAVTEEGGRFPRGAGESIELRRVRFAVFLRILQKLRHPSFSNYTFYGNKGCCQTLRFLAQKPFSVTAFPAESHHSCFTPQESPPSTPSN